METAITTQLKMELGIAKGKLTDCEKANGVAQVVISRIVGQRNNLEQENAALKAEVVDFGVLRFSQEYHLLAHKEAEEECYALKAVLGQVKGHLLKMSGFLDSRDFEMDADCAAAYNEVMPLLLSAVPKVLAVVDTEVLGDDNDSPIVWIGVPDETPIPTDVTVVVLEKGGE